MKMFKSNKPSQRTLRICLPQIFLWLSVVGCASAAPNLLIITVDDMSCDSVGVYGCKLADTTPHMDALAASGLRFDHAHVVVGNCMPSRNVMWSGRYPHNNGVEGFYPNKSPDYPVLCDLMQANGYFAAIRGKVSHSTPYHPFAWDAVLGEADGKKAEVKNPASYYTSTKEGIDLANAASKPFCVMINISDPHKPFYTGANDPYQPSRVFTAEEVPVPGFLPDDPDVRAELAEYYSSVRRADDAVGMALKALKDSGKEDETVVMFLSDHGMPLPFAKTALWHHSSRTPWMFRWPGVTAQGAVDTEHMVSAIDILPTLLDITGIAHPDGLEGRSVVALLRGQKQSGRDYIIKEYNEGAGRGRHPMRSVQGKRFMYIYNPWANGTRKFKTATTGTASYRAMQRLAKTDEGVADRLALFDLRVQEELYDIQNDPDALVNLAANPEAQAQLVRLQEELAEWMQTSGDHARESFEQRANPLVGETYVLAKEKEAADRKGQKGGKKQPQQKLIRLSLPKTVKAGVALEVVVSHSLPAELGEQKLHVTLKQGNAGVRVDRKIATISGKGKARIAFDVPGEVANDTLLVAAFVGAAFKQSLQHIVSEPLTVSGK